jgi:hypothetical protein
MFYTKGGKVLDYFKEYTKNEMDSLRFWVEKGAIFKNIETKIVSSPTSFHDALLYTSINPDVPLKVEMEVEEAFWFKRTKNIGIDAISAFHYKNGFDYSGMINNLWVNKSFIQQFKENIIVHKYGKLYTCDADIQIKMIVDDNGELLFFRAYDNKKLCSKEFQDYVENNFDLKINNKARYNQDDSWESAMYCINPKTCTELIRREINTIRDLKNLYIS